MLYDRFSSNYICAPQDEHVDGAPLVEGGSSLEEAKADNTRVSGVHGGRRRLRDARGSWCCGDGREPKRELQA